MKTKLLLGALTVGILSTGNSFAAVDYQQQAGNCPDSTLARVDSDFGYPASEETTCIKKRNNIKVVLNMSSDIENPKKPGLNQVLNNAQNMLFNYERDYGITIGNGLEMSIVAHFKGAKSLLNEPAVNTQLNIDAVKDLLARGVHIYMCQTTMSANKWKTNQLIATEQGVVEQVPAGVIALVDFAQGGWAVITP